MVLRLVIIACGVILVLAVGYFGALGGGRTNAGVGYSIQTDLQARAEAALTRAGLDWARVEMDGQTAILRGQAPRDEERSQARSAVLNARGAGGFWRGGVVRVDDRSTLAPPMSPYVFRARWDGGRVALSGASPSKSALGDLNTYARQLFPSGVVERVQVARGAPDDLAWENAARIAVTQLSNLRAGGIEIVDNTVLVRGVVDTSAALARIEQDAASLSSLFTAQIDVQVMAGASDRDGDGQVERGGGVLSPAQCQRALDRVRLNGVISFTAGSNRIEKESYPVLDRLADVAKRCASTRIVVVGRALSDQATDATLSDRSPDAFDQDLWRSRAQAVADYLVLAGVASDRALVDDDLIAAGEAGLVFQTAG